MIVSVNKKWNIVTYGCRWADLTVLCRCRLAVWTSQMRPQATTTSIPPSPSHYSSRFCSLTSSNPYYVITSVTSQFWPGDRNLMKRLMIYLIFENVLPDYISRHYIVVSSLCSQTFDVIRFVFVTSQLWLNFELL